MSASDMDKSMRTPLARARGLGSAKDGVHHWWMQRLTAVVLALLTPWFLWLMVKIFGEFRWPSFLYVGPADLRPMRPPEEVSLHMLLGQPQHALPLLAFMLALFWHAKLGLQVVIEDYVHTRWLELTLQVLTNLACSFGALTSVFAILRCVFSH
jgi:succinate dehydrogenase / fumarate reductase membrane anchor subunit